MKQIVALRKRPMKNGGHSLFLDYYIDGTRVKEMLKLYLLPENSRRDKQLNQETMAAANTMQAKKILEIQQGLTGIISRKNNILLVNYLDSRADEYRNAGSRVCAEAVHYLNHYIRRWKPGIRLSEMTEDAAVKFIKYLKSTNLSSGSIRLYFAILKTQLNIAVKRKMISQNKLIYIDQTDLPKKPDTSREYLTLEELKKLIDTPCNNEEYKRAFLFSCFSGLRLSDVCNLTWSQIHRDGDKWQVEACQQKSKRIVYVPLSANAKNLLGKPGDGKVFYLPSVKPNSRSTINKTIQKWVEQAGITKHISFHCARHTCATLLLTNGADIYTVSKILGHSSVTITQVYAKVVDEKKRAAVDAIPNLNL